MGQFILFLYDDPSTFTELSPENMQQVIEKYRAWGQGLRETGTMLESNKLVDMEGRVLDGSQGQVRLIDGPYSETKEFIGGYFRIQTDSLDHAVAIARTCPHLEYGGKVEVRPIDEV